MHVFFKQKRKQVVVLYHNYILHVQHFICASNTKCILKNQTRWNTITKLKGVPKYVPSLDFVFGGYQYIRLICILANRINNI